MGVDPARLGGPIIGVASTWTGTMPCNLNQRELADRVSEGVSWALEGDINDFGISNMAAGLARHARGADRTRYREEAAYFRSRATDYVHMFDPAIGFFQGRDESGEFKSAPADYDPRVWGHDHD